MKNLTFDRTNALCGALFMATGLFFLVQSLGLEIGTAFRMGPGYFPLVLSGILVLLGLIVAGAGDPRRRASRSDRSPGAACCSSCRRRSSSA